MQDGMQEVNRSEICSWNNLVQRHIVELRLGKAYDSLLLKEYVSPKHQTLSETIIGSISISKQIFAGG